MLSEQINTASTAAQNARAVAEENVALAGKDAAAAQLAAAQALNAPQAQPSDAQLLREFMLIYMANGVASATALSMAKADVVAFKAATAPIFQAP